MMPINEFNIVMLGLCEIYNKQPSEFLIEMYYNIFHGYHINQFKKAVTGCIKSNKYNVLPKPAEILEFLEGSKEDITLLAWIYAKEGVQKCGYFNTPDFRDPIISHCLEELGGWVKFCSTSLEELPFVKKKFMDYYRLFLKREIKEPKKLAGYAEIINNNKGYDNFERIKIGYNEEAIKLSGKDRRLDNSEKKWGMA